MQDVQQTKKCRILTDRFDTVAEMFRKARVPVDGSAWDTTTSTKPNEVYLTEKGIENIKSNLAKVIFRQDLISVYQKQTKHRDKLRADARDIVEDLISKINSEIYVSASIKNKLLQLADSLSRTSGKKVYGYLKPDVKALVDSIVEELASDERIKKLWLKIQDKKRDQEIEDVNFWRSPPRGNYVCSVIGDTCHSDRRRTTQSKILKQKEKIYYTQGSDKNLNLHSFYKGTARTGKAV